MAITKSNRTKPFFLDLIATNEDWVVFESSEATITILNDDGAIDFGDAPESYSTLLEDNGARHLISSDFPVRLGTTVDAEEEGQASKNSDGDDLLFSQDEDGVSFTTTISQGTMATVVVEITAPEGTDPDLECYLDAWIDFKGEGNWDGLQDKIFDGQPVSIGTNTLTFEVPSSAVPGLTNARFRLSSTGGLAYTGQVIGWVKSKTTRSKSLHVLVSKTVIVNLTGTDGNDTFIFTAGDMLTVDVNGAVYSYDPAEVEQILFDGGAGNDTVIFNGSSAIEAVEMWSNRGRFTGNGYLIDTNNVESITAYAGNASDTVTMTGSTGDDTFVSTPEPDSIDVTKYATLKGAGFSLRAEGFNTIEAFGAGGSDTANLNGSTGDDTYLASPNVGMMASAGVITTATNFRYITAYAVDGGRRHRDLERLGRKRPVPLLSRSC